MVGPVPVAEHDAVDSRPAAHCAGCATRRRVLVGAGVAGVALTLAACGGGSTTTAGSSGSASTTTAGSSADTGGAAPSGGASSGSTDVLATLDQVPEGGGVILGDQGVVLTRPSGDQVLGFSSTCTHMGCTVGVIADGLITCPCHGSQYHIEDGSVARGPATKGLPAVAVTLEGQDVVRA